MTDNIPSFFRLLAAAFLSIGTQMPDDTLSLSLRFPFFFITFSICGTHIDNFILIQHDTSTPSLAGAVPTQFLSQPSACILNCHRVIRPILSRMPRCEC